MINQFVAHQREVSQFCNFETRWNLLSHVSNNFLSILFSQWYKNVISTGIYRVVIIFNKPKQHCLYLASFSSLKLLILTNQCQKMQSIIVQGKVHFYEYMQVELLQEYIQKGINYFVTSLLNTSPKLIKLRYYSQQIALLIDFLKDFYHLLKHKATYAEYFFGMERESLLTAEKHNKLSKLKILINTAVMTVLPYVFSKIDSYYNNLKEQQQNQSKVLNSFQRLFTTIYPYLYMLLNVVQVIMRFRYLLFQDAKTYDLYYKCTNATLMEVQEEEEEGMVHYPWKELVKTPGLLSMLIGHKVLTWYFNKKSENKPSQRKIIPEVKQPSPLSSLKDESYTRDQQETWSIKKGSCPICTNTIQNPTVVKQTGYVYCYECIWGYVKEHQECPMTSIPLNLQSLQLIYSSG